MMGQMEDTKNANRILMGSLLGNIRLKDRGGNRRISLRRILRKYVMKVGDGCNYSRNTKVK
jgi:hypothetical protein